MDNQITSLAGEYFVAAELLKRNYQVAITVGTTKAVDLIMYDPKDPVPRTVEVKTLRKPNCFAIKLKNVHPERFYVFVILNAASVPPNFYIVPGKEILIDPKYYYGSSLGRTDERDTINRGPLKAWENRWDLFE